jgi:hypothetical protein
VVKVFSASSLDQTPPATSWYEARKAKRDFKESGSRSARSVEKRCEPSDQPSEAAMTDTTVIA